MRAVTYQASAIRDALRCTKYAPCSTAVHAAYKNSDVTILEGTAPHSVCDMPAHFGLCEGTLEFATWAHHGHTQRDVGPKAIYTEEGREIELDFSYVPPECPKAAPAHCPDDQIIRHSDACKVAMQSGAQVLNNEDFYNARDHAGCAWRNLGDVVIFSEEEMCGKPDRAECAANTMRDADCNRYYAECSFKVLQLLGAIEYIEAATKNAPADVSAAQ